MTQFAELEGGCVHHGLVLIDCLERYGWVRHGKIELQRAPRIALIVRPLRLFAGVVSVLVGDFCRNELVQRIALRTFGFPQIRAMAIAGNQHHAVDLLFIIPPLSRAGGRDGEPEAKKRIPSSKKRDTRHIINRIYVKFPCRLAEKFDTLFF